jgi:predicted RNA-binding protein with EMAP domain
VNITTYLNELNVKLQGKAFKMKLKLLHKHINEQNLKHFSFCKIALESFIEQSEWLMLKNKLVSIIQQLRNEFSSRFVDFYTSSNEICVFQNPFAIDINEVPAQMQMEVIQLQSSDH